MLIDRAFIMLMDSALTWGSQPWVQAIALDSTNRLHNLADAKLGMRVLRTTWLTHNLVDGQTKKAYHYYLSTGIVLLFSKGQSKYPSSVFHAWAHSPGT